MATSAGTVERRSRARAALALLPIARAPQFLALVGAQVPPEVEHPVQDVVGLEVGLAAVEVDESPGREAPFLIEHEPDAPATARDGLAAAAALRLRARRALGAVDPREAPVREARARRALEALPAGHVRGRFREGLKQRLRPLVGRAHRMEPQRHLALRKGVGQALAEAQLPALEDLSAAAALGAAASGGFEEVGHAGNTPRATPPGFPLRHSPAQETRGSARPPRRPRRSRRRRA